MEWFILWLKRNDQVIWLLASLIEVVYIYPSTVVSSLIIPFFWWLVTCVWNSVCSTHWMCTFVAAASIASSPWRHLLMYGFRGLLHRDSWNPPKTPVIYMQQLLQLLSGKSSLSPTPTSSLFIHHSSNLLTVTLAINWCSQKWAFLTLGYQPAMRSWGSKTLQQGISYSPCKKSSTYGTGSGTGQCTRTSRLYTHRFWRSSFLQKVCITEAVVLRIVT